MFSRLSLASRIVAPAAGAFLASGAALYNATAAPAAECRASGPNWYQVKADIVKLCDNEEAKNPSVDGAAGSVGGGGYVAPMLVRLAWHSAGSYGKAKCDGGSNGGTIRFEPEINHGGNAGLKHAIALLKPIQSAHSGLSWADLIVDAGCIAIETMGGPVCGFRPGRSDAPKPNVAPASDKRFTPDDRLPDAAQGSSHLRDVFYRMGLNDQEIVALSGAHAVGRCHTDRSGFWGPWTYGEAAFSNDYFKLLLEKKWTVKKTHNGAPWKGPMQYETDGGALMMLPSDMALLDDPAFKKWVAVYAKDEDKFFKDFAAAWQKLTERGCEFA